MLDGHRCRAWFAPIRRRYETVGPGGGPDGERLEYNGRPQYPERLHVIGLVLDVTTRLLAQLDSFFTETAQETSSWTSATNTDLTSKTRQRLETVQNRSPK